MYRAGKRVIEYMEWGGREGWEKGMAEIGLVWRWEKAWRWLRLFLIGDVLGLC